MLCRILLTAATILCTFSSVLIVHANNKTSQQLEQIKDIVCVLLLSGLTKQDLNEDTEQKLKQHNVDFDTINTKEMRESCLDVNITNDSSQYVNDNIVRSEINDHNSNFNCTSGQNYCNNKTKSESNIKVMMDKTDTDFSAYLWNVTKYAFTLLHDKIGMVNKGEIENNKIIKDKTKSDNLEIDHNIVNNQYSMPENREGIKNVTKLNKTQLFENSLWNITREEFLYPNKSNYNINSHETTATPSNYVHTENLIYLESKDGHTNFRKKQLANDGFLYRNYNKGNFKINKRRNLIKLKQINNNLNIYPKVEPIAVKYNDDNIENIQVNTSQENDKLSEILTLLSNIQNSINNVNQSYTTKTSINDNRNEIEPKNKRGLGSTKQVEDTQIVTSSTEKKITRSQVNMANKYTQLLKVPNLVSISKLLQHIYIIPPEDTRLELNYKNNTEKPRKNTTENPNLRYGDVHNLLNEIKQKNRSISTIINNNNDSKSNINSEQKDFIQLLSDSLWEKINSQLRNKLLTASTPSTTPSPTTTVAITSTMGVVNHRQLEKKTKRINLSLSATITPNLIQDIVNKVKVTILKEFKNESIEKNTEKTNYDDISENVELMRDFLNIFKQFKSEVAPTTKKISNENGDFQINHNNNLVKQRPIKTHFKKISSLNARQNETPYSPPKNIMPQFDMIPSIQYSMPSKSPVMIQTNLFEIPPLYQPAAILDVTNLLPKPKEAYSINGNDRWQNEHDNTLRHKSYYQVGEPKDEKSRFRTMTINHRNNNKFPEVFENKPNLNNMFLKQTPDMYLKDSYNKYKMDIQKIVPIDKNKIYDDILKSSLNTEPKYNADASKINLQWNSDFNSAVWNKLTQKHLQNQESIHKQKYDFIKNVLFKNTPNTIEQISVKKDESDFDVYTSKESNDNIDYNVFIKNIKAIISKGSPFQTQVNSKVQPRNKDVYIDSLINRDSISKITNVIKKKSVKKNNLYSKNEKITEKRIKYIAKNKNADDVINTITNFDDRSKIKINSQEVIHNAKQINIDNIIVQDLLKKLKNEKFHVESSDIPTIENNSDSDNEMVRINSKSIPKAQASRNKFSNPNSYQELLKNIQKDVLQFVQNKNNEENDDVKDDIKKKIVNHNYINVNRSNSRPSAQIKVKDKVVMNNDIIDQLNNLVSKLKSAQYVQNMDNNDEIKQTSLSILDITTEALHEYSPTKLYYENNTYVQNLVKSSLHGISNTKLELTENPDGNKKKNVYGDLVEKIKDGTIKSNNIQDIINEITRNILDSKSKSNEDITKRNDVTNDLIISRIKEEVMKNDNFTDIFKGIIKQVIHSAANQESFASIEKPNKELNIKSSKIDNYNDVTTTDTVKDNIEPFPKSDPPKSNPSIYDDLINQNFDFAIHQKNSPTENNINIDIFNDLISLNKGVANKVSNSPSTTITYNEMISDFRDNYQREHVQNFNSDFKPTSDPHLDISNKIYNLNQYSEQNPNYNSLINEYIKNQSNPKNDVFKEFLKHSSVFGLKSNDNMLEIQATPKPNSDLIISTKTIKSPDNTNKIDSPMKSTYKTESKPEEKYKVSKTELKDENTSNQFRNRDNKRINREQPSKTNSDYDEIKIRNTYKYSDEGKSKLEAREHIQKIIDTLDHEIEERTKLQVSQRYQAPIRHVKRTRSRNDINFKKFIKTQQKVNDFLGKILANNSHKRSNVVTI